MSSAPFLLAQISDLHLKAGGALCYGVVDTAAHLRRCVAHLLSLPQRPDALVATGDLADGGSAAEYALLRELLAPLGMPVYVIPGNHDERGALRTAFADQGYMQQSDHFVQYAIEAHALRIVALDTTIPGAEGGELDEARLDWLHLCLAQAPQRPTVVLMHHPPFPTFIDCMDRIGLADPGALGLIVSRNPQIERILCGHVHRATQVRWNGTLASTCPSTAHQIALNVAPAAPGGFVLEPPAYQLHAWRPGAGLVSHTVCVGDFAGPYPFGD